MLLNWIEDSTCTCSFIFSLKLCFASLCIHTHICKFTFMRHTIKLSTHVYVWIFDRCVHLSKAMAQAVTKEGYLEGEWVWPLVFFHSISLESQHITQLASRFFSFPKICTLSVKQTQLQLVSKMWITKGNSFLSAHTHNPQIIFFYMAGSSYSATGCIEHDCRHINSLQVHQLVLHQGYKWSDDQCKAW